jgi:hypothetical protein
MVGYNTTKTREESPRTKLKKGARNDTISVITQEREITHLNSFNCINSQTPRVNCKTRNTNAWNIERSPATKGLMCVRASNEGVKVIC